MPRVNVQTQPFDAGAEMRLLGDVSEGVGAVASFVGRVRNQNQGDTVASLELEHYPGMTEKSINSILDEAEQRWSLLATRVIHRIGLLRPGEDIVFVGVASAHRGDAFTACEFIMDHLKTRAPFWKKEVTPEGTRWVDARCSDSAAAARWS